MFAVLGLSHGRTIANYQMGWAMSAVGWGRRGEVGMEEETFTSDRRRSPLVGCEGVDVGVMRPRETMPAWAATISFGRFLLPRQMRL
jgi:hypothetical protein